VRELSEAEFNATFGSAMRPVAAPADLEASLAAVEQILEARGGDAPPREPELSHSYVGADGHHAHLLFWYGVPNVYVVIVLALPGRSIIGHHRLDLNEKYGLPVPSDPTWWPPLVH
jgi:hypothetical protein